MQPRQDLSWVPRRYKFTTIRLHEPADNGVNSTTVGTGTT